MLKPEGEEPETGLSLCCNDPSRILLKTCLHRASKLSCDSTLIKPNKKVIIAAYRNAKPKLLEKVCKQLEPSLVQVNNL